MLTNAELVREIRDTKLPYGQCAFWWLGQMGFALKMGDTMILMDPFITDMLDRLVKCPLRLEDVAEFDLILGSHNHDDHIDRQAWKQIAKMPHKCKFGCSEALIPILAEELDIDKSEFVAMNEARTVSVCGVTVTGIAAAHEFFDDVDGLYPHLGYVVEGNGCTIYHAGDGCNYEGLQTKLSKWHHDAMFLPVNGRDAYRFSIGCIGNMTYQEAMDLGAPLKPGLLVPGHYDMIEGNTLDPKLFTDYMDLKYPGVGYWVGEHCQKVIFGKAD